MTIYVVLATWPCGISQVIGVYSSYEKAEEAKKNGFTIWNGGTREIIEKTLDFCL